MTTAEALYTPFEAPYRMSMGMMSLKAEEWDLAEPTKPYKAMGRIQAAVFGYLDALAPETGP